MRRYKLLLDEGKLGQMYREAGVGRHEVTHLFVIKGLSPAANVFAVDEVLVTHELSDFKVGFHLGSVRGEFNRYHVVFSCRSL